MLGFIVFILSLFNIVCALPGAVLLKRGDTEKFKQAIGAIESAVTAFADEEAGASGAAVVDVMASHHPHITGATQSGISMLSGEQRLELQQAVELLTTSQALTDAVRRVCDSITGKIASIKEEAPDRIGEAIQITEEQISGAQGFIDVTVDKVPDDAKDIARPQAEEVLDALRGLLSALQAA